MRKGAVLLLSIILLNLLIIPQILPETITSQTAQAHTLSNENPNNTLPLGLMRQKPLKLPEIETLYSKKYVLEFGEPLLVPSGILEGYWLPFIPNTRISMQPGYPLLPVNISVIELPHDAQDIQVQIHTTETKVLEDSYNILPSPKPLVMTRNNASINELFEIRKRIFEKYPSSFLEYRVLNGIDTSTLERKKFLVIYFYPLTYTGDGELIFVRKAVIDISYRISPSVRQLSLGNLEALIITSNDLFPEALLLARMKNSSGISTIVRTVEWIYSNYQGRDKPEKIRAFIKDMVNEYGIKFVIIFGDADKVPTREVWVPDGAYDYDPSIDGSTVATDLYYADLDYSWDDNGDGLWGDLRYDRVDGLPDVIVGRIPVSNESEARAYLEKLARYKPSSDWFNNVLLIGSDTFMTGWPEGEYLSDYITRFIWANFSVTKLYETAGNLTLPMLIHQINKGYGLINYDGHGDVNAWIISLGSIYAMDNALQQINREHLSIIFSMACLTARFDDRDSIGEAFVLNPNGGAIGYVGATRLSWGYIGELVITGLAGEMSWRFVKNFFSPLNRYLGSVWAATISEYAINNPIETNYYGYYLDWKTVAEFVLFGDPTISLRPIPRENVTEIPELIGDNTSVLIRNATMTIHSLDLSSSNLTIYNSTIHVKNQAKIQEYSRVILNGSFITGEVALILNNTILMIDNSVIEIPIILIGNTTVSVRNSYVNGITVLDNFSWLRIENSSINLLLRIDEKGEILIREGFCKSMNLLDLVGYNISLNNTHVLLGLNVTGAELNITNSILSSVFAYDAAIQITNSAISSIKVVGKTSLVVDNSRTGVELSIIDAHGVLKLAESPKYLRINGDNFTGVQWSLELMNTNITTWRIRLYNSSLEVRDSTVYEIVAEESELLVIDSKVSILNAINTICNIENTRVYYERLLFSNITSADSRIEYLWANNSFLDLRNVTGYDTKFLNSSLSASIIYYYHVVFTGSQRSFMSESKVAILEIFDYAELIIKASRVAVMFLRNSSYVRLENTTVTYAARIMDNTTLLAKNSIIWPELVFVNTNTVIKNLVAGNITSLELINGWNITIMSSVVIGWDIILYNSSAEISESQIYWLFGYYSSRVRVEKSWIDLLRLTHFSSGEIVLSRISQAVLSGFSETTLRKSSVSSMTVMGNAKAGLSMIKSTEVVVFTNASVAVHNSLIRFLAPFDSSSVVVENSAVGIWLELYNIVNKTIRLKPGYYIMLTEADIGLPNIDWSLSVKESRINWYLLLVNSSARIKDSQLTILGFLDSSIIVENSLIIDILQAVASDFLIRDTVGANVTTIINGVGTLENSSFTNLMIQDSEIEISDCKSTLTLVFADGELELSLRPAYYKDAWLNYTAGSETINLHLMNSWINNWMVLLMGRARVSIVDSNVLTVGAAENATLIVRNTTIYGYLELFPTASILVESSLIGNLYWFLYSTELAISIPAPNISDMELNASGYLRIIDSFLYNIHLEATLSNISIFDTPRISETRLIMSKLIAQNSIIDKIKAASSSLDLTQSIVNTTEFIGTDAKISRSTIKNLGIDQFSNVIVEYSSIGLNMVFRFFNIVVKGEEWKSENSNSTIIGDYWVLQLSSSNITSASFTLVGTANATISNSRLKALVCKDFSTANITESEIETLILEDAAHIALSNSVTGVEIRVENTETEFDLKTNIEVSGKISALRGIGYELSLKDTVITGVNITAVASKVVIDNSEIMMLVADYGSRVFVNSSRVILALLGSGAKIWAEDSEIRLLTPHQINKVYLDNCQVGVSLLLMGRKEKLVLGSGFEPYFVTNDNFMDWLIEGYYSEIIDWRVLALQGSNVTLEYSHILLVYAEANSWVRLIDCQLELPPIVTMQSIVEIYWSLGVRVLRDLIPISNINVTIYNDKGELVASSTTNEAGEAIFYLPQAIILDSARIDLGNYVIKVKYGYLGASKRIYLWKPTSVTIYLMGPLTIALIGFTIILIGILIKTVVEILRERKKPKAPAFP